MIEKKPRSLLLPLGVVGLLAGVGVAASWILTQRGAFSGMPVGANILPQSTLMSVSVTTQTAQWQKLQAFGTRETQLAFTQGLADWQTRLLSRNGYRYQTDIQPWIGEQATLAFLPGPAPSTTSGLEQSLVWVLPIKNPDQARQALAKRQQATKSLERTYKGLKIQEIQGSSSQAYSTTVLDERLVVASNAQAMEQVVDTYRGKASLATVPGYRSALREINGYQPFAQVYVNLPAAASAAIARSGRSVSPEALASIQQSQGLSSTVTLESDGVRFKSISWLNPNSQRTLPVPNKAQDLHTRLPANTLIMASGSNFQQLWQDYAQGAQPQLALPFNPEQFRTSIRAATGMDFDQDFVKWMNGEFALAVVPAGGNTPQGAAVVLMAQTRDRRLAERSFKQLDTVMSRQFNLNVSQSKIGNRTLTTWKVPPRLPVATHGWLDSNVAFLSLGAPIETTFVPQPQTALAGSELFQAATRSNLKPASGYFFVDMNRTQTLLNNSPLLPKLAPNLRKFATAIQGIGVTAAVKNERSTRYDVLVKLKKTENPQAFSHP
ncbi:MAG TPA: DUF3352 domain-containing protein, partial [Candidatus Caenarcaniphilales bacterium]